MLVRSRARSRRRLPRAPAPSSCSETDFSMRTPGPSRSWASKSRLPAMYSFRSNVEVGGLISYGVNDIENLRRAAVFVDKILKGAKAADLRIEQPTTFE